MNYTIVTAERQVFYINDLTDDVLEKAKDGLLMVISNEDGAYLVDGEWEQINDYED